MSFLDDYEPVEDRLRQFWEDHPFGRVITTLEHHVDGDYIVRAEVYVGNELRNDPPTATGYAHDSAAQLSANMKASALEVCETSAIGRALANMGYAPKGKRPSREEMQKASAPAASHRTEPVQQEPDLGTGSALPGPPQVAQSENVSLDGAVSDAAPVSTGGADTGAATPSDALLDAADEGNAMQGGVLHGTDEPASQEQWHRLLQVVGGSKAKAVNRLNKANKTSYTTASSIGATQTELANAITGGDA